MIILWILGGLVAGVAYVLLAGILEVQITGSLEGGVYNLNNEIVAVTQPNIPFLQYASLAVLSAVILLVATRSVATERLPRRIALLGGFAVAVIILIVWGFVLQGAAMAETGGVREGLPSGLPGWILKGGLSVVVHAVGLIAVTSAVFTAVRARGIRGLEPGAGASAPSAAGASTR